MSPCSAWPAWASRWRCKTSSRASSPARYLLFERPFRIGDEISIKDQRGIVEHIGIRTTQLRNADNVQIIIPNGVVFAELIANRTNEIKPEPPPEPADARDDVADHEDGDSSPVAAAAPAACPSGCAVSSSPYRHARDRQRRTDADAVRSGRTLRPMRVPGRIGSRARVGAVPVTIGYSPTAPAGRARHALTQAARRLGAV